MSPSAGSAAVALASPPTREKIEAAERHLRVGDHARATAAPPPPPPF